MQSRINSRASWVAPVLEELSVTKTLGGTLNQPDESFVLFQNDVEIDRGPS